MKLKNRFLLCLAATITLSTITTGCSHRTVVVKGNPSKPLPPGQAKKITGSKSAKPYAPGQQKKQ